MSVFQPAVFFISITPTPRSLDFGSPFYSLGTPHGESSGSQLRNIRVKNNKIYFSPEILKRD